MDQRWVALRSAGFTLGLGERGERDTSLELSGGSL